MYGALAGIAVLMLYVYGSAFILLLGAEMNQVIERRSPDGKDTGERRPRDGT
jgi:membrane protein